MLHRRSALGVLAGALALPAFRTRAAAPGALKIAALESLSGPGSEQNRLFAAGIRYGVMKMNEAGGFVGRPVEFAEYDTQGTSSGAAEKARQALADGASILCHGSSSASGGQIGEDVRRHNIRNPKNRVLFFGTGLEALELTGDKCQYYFFRFATNAPIRVRALAAAMKDVGALGQKVFCINQSYTWGRDVEAAVRQLAPQYGYTVVDSVVHDAFKIQDFSPYVARIAASGADTVFCGNSANDITYLVKAIRSAGLKINFGAAFLDLPGTLSAAGDAAVGYFEAERWNREAFGDWGVSLWADYRAKMGVEPSGNEIKAVLTLGFLQEALRSLRNAGAFDADAVAVALEKTTWNLPTGPLTMRAEDHQALFPIIVSRVEKNSKYPADGTDMGFTPIRVIPGKDAQNDVQATCKFQRPT